MSWIAITAAVAAWTVLVVVIGYSFGHRGAHAAIADVQAAAQRDPLTGLLNRSGLEAAARPSRGAVIALVDLDDFKAINDTYGHRAGDGVLTTAGQRLGAHAARHGGLAARLGGDEFVILLPAAAACDMPATGSLLHHQLTTGSVPICGIAVDIRASVGLSQLAPHEDLYDAIHRADQAMYRAKTTRAQIAVQEQQPPAPVATVRPQHRSSAGASSTRVARASTTISGASRPAVAVRTS